LRGSRFEDSPGGKTSSQDPIFKIAREKWIGDVAQVEHLLARAKP
jgi:hypothetical protein